MRTAPSIFAAAGILVIHNISLMITLGYDGASIFAAPGICYDVPAQSTSVIDLVQMWCKDNPASATSNRN